MRVKQGLLIFLFCLSAFIGRGQALAGVYGARWRVVDSLIGKKGLTQSALDEVNKIYALARQEKNEPEVIRALVYRLHLEGVTTEGGIHATIKELQKEIDESLQPERSILQTVLAGVYLGYLQENRWQISNRTNAGPSADEDVATMTIDDLNRTIGALYLASLKQEELLARIDLNVYDPIVIPGNVRWLRPTLFDLLAHTALDYFKAGDSYIGQYSQPMEIGDPAAFAGAATFVTHRWSPGDSLSPSYQALLILQRLIRRHLEDRDPDALLDVDIERLSYVQSIFSGENKQELYLRALAALADRYKAVPAADQAWYLQANEYAANATNGLDSTGNIKARAICGKVVAKNDSSEGWANCKNLLNTIIRQALSLWTEDVNIPNRPMRLMVSWRNFTRLYLRVVRVDEKTKFFLASSYFYDSNYLPRLLALPVYHNAVEELPDSRDYLEHRVEMGLSGLPPGDYVLLGNTDSTWSLGTGVIAVGQFAVSIISYISQGDDYFVLNRENGRPLADVDVQLWERVRNEGKPSDLKKGGSYRTDGDGHFRLRTRPKDDHSARLFEFSIPGDRLFPSQEFYHTVSETPDWEKNKESYEKHQRNCFLFTDRSIYRPGQTVYFKGIVVTRDFDTHHARLIAGETSKLFLLNANSEKIDSLTLTTNEYGSFHGSFLLPKGQLNGQFRIEDYPGNRPLGFAVEEYKRPKFIVDYETQKGSYRVGDSIRVSGTARGYAGNIISQGKVTYNVVRSVRYPHTWAFLGNRRPYFAEVTIAHGTTVTDANGRFIVLFLASPDPQVSRSEDPVFEYTVSADVTDISGETQSGSTAIPAGYSALQLSIKVADGGHLPADSFRRVVLNASNLSGGPVAATVQLAIYPLKAPQRLIRARLWQAPDRWVMTEKEWLDSFPNDEYRNETEQENWERGEQLWAMDTTIAGEGPDAGQEGVDIPAGKLVPGWYVVEARTTDRYGQAVKELSYIELYDARTGRPGNPQYSWGLEGGGTAEPGQSVTTTSGSSADVYVIRMRQHGGGDQADPFSHFTLAGEKKSTEWAITDADRGGFGVLDAWVKDNRLYTHFSMVRVPWTNKELEIHYTTFRDKSEPGSGEKWAMKISGHQGEKVTAEAMTTMYDASLDQFQEHNWDIPGLYPYFNVSTGWEAGDNFSCEQSQDRDLDQYSWRSVVRLYDQLLMPKEVVGRKRLVLINGKMFFAASDLLKKLPSVSVSNSGERYVHAERMKRDMSKFYDDDSDKVEVAMGLLEPKVIADNEVSDFSKAAAPAPPIVQARKDFRETAFFLPDLRTDSAGNVSFSFTMPEAVTSWKWMTLAHTRDLAFGYGERTVITQKALMVQPNAPRFLREGDRMELPVKVVNLTDSELTGQMSLQLTDPTTGQSADGWFINRQANQYFTVGAKQSVMVGFPIEIPYQYNRPLTYTVVAQAGNYSDGEEATLPVVSNRLLVTESLPLNMPGDGERHFTFDKLLKSGSSETLNNHALTVEFTANPAWYAVQSLPYLMEYPHECSEQLFERVYANALASHILGSTPRLRQVFDRWRTADTTALLSNLQKDQELKSVLLEETPWVLQGKTEAQQKKNIALLFDMARMSRELTSALDRLQNMQSSSGAFPWWPGGPDSRYITQYIVTGIGHLQKLGAIPAASTGAIDTIVDRALGYLDAEVIKDYRRAKAGEARGGPGGGVGEPIGPLAAQYLYMRSLFPNRGLPGGVFSAVNYFRKKAQHDWLQCNRYQQGMIALALYRTGDIETARDIMASLKQNAIRDPGQGMYWKGMEGGYYWYQAPVETESLLIEAFREITGDTDIDRDLKTWLLKQKQTHEWSTTTATADACYALLAGGQDWLNAERSVQVKLGGKTIDWPAGSGEAGAGYNKKVFDAAFVNPAMGNIGVKTEGGGGPAWGAVYWQYFDMLDRITPPGSNKTALSVSKKLFIRRDTDRGPVLEALSDNGTVKPGDRVVARIELRADRDLEYVHMKDMRAACLEPVNVISQYKWQGGLGYYESTKDASTDFFFDVVPRGTYVFEYEMLAGQSGNFSNGITTVECLYAPEFSCHTEGIRVNVEPGN